MRTLSKKQRLFNRVRQEFMRDNCDLASLPNLLNACLKYPNDIAFRGLANAIRRVIVGIEENNPYEL